MNENDIKTRQGLILEGVLAAALTKAGFDTINSGAPMTGTRIRERSFRAATRPTDMMMRTYGAWTCVPEVLPRLVGQKKQCCAGGRYGAGSRLLARRSLKWFVG